MHEYSKNHIGDLHHMSAHVATNGGGGIASAAILGSAELSANNGTNVDAIQYTSVIVEPTNYHMTNEYVHWALIGQEHCSRLLIGSLYILIDLHSLNS